MGAIPVVEALTTDPNPNPIPQDCLAMGAIPVFFHETQLAIWPDAGGSWLRDAVIFIDQKDVQAPYHLTILPSYHPTILPPYPLSILPSYHLTILPIYHPTHRQADDGARVLATLRAVDDVELDRKRALIRKYFGRMVWAYESGEGDVFDRVLELAADYARGVDSKLHSGELVSQCCQHADDDTRS